MYVWFDALTNYISTLGWPDDTEGNYKKFWEEGDTLQLAGKDQVRFQSIMWQAMLKSAGLPSTECVVYHGFVNSGGHKMSKSIGNVISPYELVARYGTDATRYILLRHVHPFEDTDITWERMDEWYTANLVNGLGNLTSRILKMSETYGVAHTIRFNEYLDAESIIDGNLQKALDDIWVHIGEMDAFIQREEPFKKIKVDPEKAKEDVEYLLTHLEGIAGQLRPFMPHTSETILNAIRDNKKPENLFPRIA
jgi:methionyl-tRNA synthetase